MAPRVVIGYINVVRQTPELQQPAQSKASPASPQPDERMSVTAQVQVMYTEPATGHPQNIRHNDTFLCHYQTCLQNQRKINNILLNQFFKLFKHKSLLELSLVEPTALKEI